MIADHLLTDADLVDLTGYVQPAEQARVLREAGLRPIIRRDGRPRITWEAVTRANLNTALDPEARNDTGPNFAALRATG